MSTLDRAGVTSADNHTATTTVVVARPEWAQPGRLLMAWVSLIGQPAITAPEGWILLGTVDAGENLRGAVYRRTVAEDEPDSYGWSWSDARKNFVVLLGFEGQATQPIPSWAAAAGTSGTSHPTPTVRVPAGGRLITLAAARRQGAPAVTWLINTGDTELYDSASAQESPAQNIAGAVWDSGVLVSAGDYDRTLTSSQSVGLVVTASIALRPAGADEALVGWTIGIAAGISDDTPPPPPPELAFVGQDDALLAATAATSISAPVPDGVADEDWMFAHIAAITNVTISPPAGDTWTQVGTTRVDGQLATAVFRRRAGSSEPGSYSWGFSASARAAARIVAYRGVDADDPIADVANAGEGSAGSTLTLPDVDVPEDGWLVMLVADRRNAPSVAQNWTSSDDDDTRRGQVSGATGSNFQASSAAFDSDRPLSASTPTRTVTATEGWSNTASIWALALQPAT